ncbi:IGHG protein, partial [Nicator chloris]|nr:IGHG protein [Nicator chloris]
CRFSSRFFPNFPNFPFFLGTRLAPSVYLLPPPLEELSGPRPTLSLTCLVRGFFPEDIDVQWQKNQENLETSGRAPGASGQDP